MEHYGWRPGTGFLSTPFILDVLAEMGVQDACRLLENEEMPGWLFMPKNGANTIWESWEGTQAQGGIASLNHYSKGAVCEWLFRTMCGIHIDEENHFCITPRPGGHLSHARAMYQSVYGQVESGWRHTDAGTEFSIKIPRKLHCPGDPAGWQRAGPGQRTGDLLPSGGAAEQALSACSGSIRAHSRQAAKGGPRPVTDRRAAQAAPHRHVRWKSPVPGPL